MSETYYHIPALLSETIEGLNIQPGGVYVDATFGGGGHSRAILEKLGETGRLIAFDQDEDVLPNLIDDKRFVFAKSNFRYLRNFLRYHSIDKVDGVLADLGVSFHHFDNSERGFSFRFEGVLDMRMNKKASKTAADILNTYAENQLADLFYHFGELRQSRKIASIIVKRRNAKPIEEIADFIEILKPLFSREKEKKEMSLVFQALRIEVNSELDVLYELLEQSVEILNPKGRLVVLTYHSLEDRIVKNFIRSGNVDGKIVKDFYGNLLSPLKVINNKVIVPTNDEIQKNPRSRSAKLRIAEKIL
ncbi:MAG: 16S rRNA (cytosine(1402)-N(4))-methyltransferase RsmH [Paludibacteraceae bacterium]